MRTTFEKARKRFLQVSSNLLLIHTSGSSAKEAVCKTAGNGSAKRQTVVKAECEPVYNELDDSFAREPDDSHARASSSSLSSEQESTYLDIDLDKDVEEGNDSLQHCTEKSMLPYGSHQSESSFTESKPSLTADEIVLLYAKIDKTKKTKNRVCGNDGESGPVSLDSTTCKADIDNELQPGRVNKSLSKFGDFHPKKVNELQLPKSVVNVSLNEFVAEHSRIHCKEKNTTACGLECRPLPALPSQMGKHTSAKINEAMMEHNDESDSQNIYATLPLNKS